MSKAEDATKLEILSDRGSKYRRTVLALSIVLAAYHYYPDAIDLSKLKVFGAEFKNGDYARSVLIGALWVGLLYNVVMFMSYVRRDWYIWRAMACDTHYSKSSLGFPQIRMFFGVQPSETVHNPRQFKIKSWTRSIPDDWSNARWIGSGEDGAGTSYENVFSLPMNTYFVLRDRMFYFFVWEVGLPLLISAIALWFGLLALARCACVPMF